MRSKRGEVGIMVLTNEVGGNKPVDITDSYKTDRRAVQFLPLSEGSSSNNDTMHQNERENELFDFDIGFGEVCLYV